MIKRSCSKCGAYTQLELFARCDCGGYDFERPKSKVDPTDALTMDHKVLRKMLCVFDKKSQSLSIRGGVPAGDIAKAMMYSPIV